MGYIKGTDRQQLSMPESIDHMISQDNPVRVMDAFVDMLDMASLGFEKERPSATGRPSYAPGMLLKLYIYGYFNAIRSSRRLMRECTRNIELFFLLDRLTPDFRTIADFRKNNKEAIRNTFSEFTKFCMFLNLYDARELLAIDGSKFRAVNGNKKMFNLEILSKKLQRINEKTEKYLQALSEADEKEAEVEEQAEKLAELQEKLQVLTQRKETYEAWKQELLESGDSQKLTTDPEAKMMHTTKDGYHCCYNVQTAVSAESHFIVDYVVTNHVNDQGILHDFCESIKETIGEPTIEVVADKGYDCKEEELLCLMDATTAYIGFKEDKSEHLYPLEYIPNTITSKEKDSCRKEDIRKCLHAGVLPSCYEGKNITLEVHALGKIGAFIRNEDKSYVTCPMGFRLNKTKDKRNGMVYLCRTACRQCSNRCTASKRHKEVYFGPNSNCVAVRMYGTKDAIHTPPVGFVPTNSFFKKNPVEKTLLLRIADDPAKQRQRLCISEHPFGSVKWHSGAHYVLCKGIAKTTAELGLSFLAYNLRRAINLVGTKSLMDAMRGV